ncbi:MAG: membrane protein insertase YidC [Acidimicrobiales bacterium]|nr:membrane protein insertase YidC [Acidimicrobiales bacterium]
MILHLAALVHAASTTTTTVAQGAKHGSSILDPINKAIANVLAGIYAVVPNFGVAIIVLSVIWMVLISPLTLKSTRSMLAMQKLQPQLKKLQEQHKNDRQAFAQAQMDLFREHQVSPFGSCLPMILPLPVFFALFRVIDGLSHKANGVPAPKYLSSHAAMYHAIKAGHGKIVAFGMDMSKNALSSHHGVLAALPFWILLLAMAGTSYLQSAQMMSRNPQAQSNPQMRMMKYLPLLFVVLCIRFPAGVVLYYTTSNVCRIIQQDFMYRFDPKVKALVAQEVIEVEEITREIDESKNKRGPGYTPPRGAKPTAGGGRAGPATPGSGGRSRFRDLLAAAAEQQKSQQQSKSGRSRSASPPQGPTAKSGSGGSKALPAGPRSGDPKANGNGSRSGAPNGNDPASGERGGAGGASNSRGGNRNRSNPGSRTNRKRRGR